MTIKNFEKVKVENTFDRVTTHSTNESVIQPMVSHVSSSAEVTREFSSEHSSLRQQSNAAVSGSGLQDQSHSRETPGNLDFDTPINIQKAHTNFFEIRRLTGYSWTELAELLDVDRRTIFNWAGGANIRKSNKAHIAATLDVLRYSNSGSSDDNRKALRECDSDGSTTPLEQIKGKNYSMAKNLLGKGIPYIEKGKNKATFRSGTDSMFLSDLIHPGADGTEKSEPLPYEPPMPSVKWPHPLIRKD